MNICYASLCSGISCESVAWLPLGWQPIFFAEIDPFACAVLRHHYPDVPNLGDIRQVDGRAWRGKVDVLIAGTPCQGFSVAGKRGMLSDPRSNLALEYARIIHEAQIPVSIFENVPGVLAGDVRSFQTILERIIGAEKIPKEQLPEGRWPGAGMAAGPERIAAWRLADAQHFGVAQRRRRVFVVSVDPRTGINPGALLFEFERLPGDSAPGRETGAQVARCAGASTGGASAKEQQLTFISGDNIPLNALSEESDQIPLCMAHGQGGAEISTNRCPTLNCNHEAPIALSTAPTPKWSQDKAFTLTQPSCSGGGQPQAVAHVYPLQEIGKRTGISTNNRQVGIGIGNLNDPMFTVQASSQHGVAHTLRGEGHDASEDGTGRGVPLTVSLRGREGGNTAELGSDISNAVRTGGGGGDKPHVLSEMAVRRLTPREVERLQGLKDDYTLIPYGKSAHTKDLAEMAAYWGVTPEVAATLAADSHRYRAVGNGMAVPVVRWLGDRIELAMKLVGYVPVAERD